MILPDTHIWVWWIMDEQKLSQAQIETIEDNEADVIGISPISCWEVAKLVQVKRLELPVSLEIWFEEALNYPGVRLLPLSPEIAIQSTRLPGQFHRDPADQIIVATALENRCPLLTLDQKILDYPHVKTIA